ncbi:MAG: NAD(P)H-dependent oxidoreductase [Bdellovibrionales bacterium]
MNPQQIVEKLNWRYAVKKFDAKRKISESDWNVLAESLRLAPSSYGLQPWKFLVIRNRDILKKLTPATWNQTQVEDCSHYVVFATPTRMTTEHVENFVQKMVSVRGVERSTLQGYYSMMNKNVVENLEPAKGLEWMRRQAYIAMGFLMETAALMDLDSCPIEGLEPEKYDQILGLKEKGWSAIASVALGYRHADDKYQSAKKVRFDRKDVIEYVD